MKHLKRILFWTAVAITLRLIGVWLVFPLPALIVVRLFLVLVALLAGLTLIDAFDTPEIPRA